MRAGVSSISKYRHRHQPPLNGACHEAALRMQISCELALALRFEPQALHTTRQDTCFYSQNSVLNRKTETITFFDAF
jgi:hypothetical protein